MWPWTPQLNILDHTLSSGHSWNSLHWNCHPNSNPALGPEPLPFFSLHQNFHILQFSMGSPKHCQSNQYYQYVTVLPTSFQTICTFHATTFRNTPIVHLLQQLFHATSSIHPTSSNNTYTYHLQLALAYLLVMRQVKLIYCHSLYKYPDTLHGSNGLPIKSWVFRGYFPFKGKQHSH